MRINKKRLRQILVEHCNRVFLPECDYVREKPWLLEDMRELLRRGRRERNALSEYIARQLDFCVRFGFLKMGYEVSSAPDENLVRVLMLTRGKNKTWLRMSRDIAEKILVFGEVPNLRAS